jgi:mediator of RNA polymerase II transcription subunit 12
VTSHLKRQLTELALPTTSKLGLHIKSTFKGVLFDSDSRTRWVLRLSYL